MFTFENRSDDWVMDRKNKPLVSIIIPSYKSAKTLKHVLEPIKNQTYDNIKVIVVD